MNNNQSVDEIEFSNREWNLYPSKRIYMYENLIQEYDFYDMNKDEILQLLGYEYCSISKDGSIIYYMGEKSNGWFSYNLFISFDGNNMVKEFQLYQD